MVVQSSGPGARLPIGTYRLAKQSVVATDIEGRVWMVETYPSYRADVLFELVREGKVARLNPRDLEVTADSGPEIPAFGPPLVLGIRAYPRDDEVYVSLSPSGERGDRVRDVLVDGSKPPAPVFQILSAGGKVIAEDQFKYG